MPGSPGKRGVRWPNTERHWRGSRSLYQPFRFNLQGGTADDILINDSESQPGNLRDASNNQPDSSKRVQTVSLAV